MARIKFVYEPEKPLVCNACNETKQQKEFYRRSKPPGYLIQPCKVCHVKQQLRLTRELGLNRTEYARRAKKRWIERTIEKRNAWRREYAKRPERKLKRNEYLNRTGNSRKYVTRRRALKAKAEGSHTEREWENVKLFYGHRCAVVWCKRTDLTRDHIVALSKGGTDYIENIQPLCRPHNSSKLAQENDEWLRKLGEITNDTD